jgi:hypothetical protein
VGIEPTANNDVKEKLNRRIGGIQDQDTVTIRNLDCCGFTCLSGKPFEMRASSIAEIEPHGKPHAQPKEACP